MGGGSNKEPLPMYLDSTVCTLSLGSVQFGQKSSNIHMTVSQEMTETKQQQLCENAPRVCCECMYCLEFTSCSIISIGEIILLNTCG